jgi:two-component system LytT family response regulator
MLKLKCVAIDDEPLALALIAEYASRFPAIALVKSFEDAISGAEYLNNNPIDLLFVDIDMPDIRGTDLVRSLTNKPIVIFTTAYKQFAHEGFELEALDYLLKPIDFTRFSRTVTKALAYHEYQLNPKVADEESIFVNVEYKLVKISLNEIHYIESFADYIEIHLFNGTTISTLLTLKKILERLPEVNFKRIHRSYIVSIKQVKSVHNRKVELFNGKELPIGESYLQALRSWIR